MLAKEDIRREWEQGHLIVPAVNIYDTDDDFVMRLRMPGVKKDGVEIKVTNGELSIYGRVGTDVRDPNKFILKELDDGNYYRVFRIADTIEVSQIKAKMEDGMLTVTLPKHERVKPRDIPIEVG